MNIKSILEAIAPREADSNADLQAIRSHLVNICLGVAVTLGLLALLLSYAQSLEEGFGLDDVLNLLLYLIILGSVLLRHRLSFHVRVTVLLGTCLLLAISDTLNYGLAGSGFLELVVFSILVTAFFGLRSGTLAGAASTVLVLLAGWGVSNGLITFSFNLAKYVRDPVVWLGTLTTFLFMVIAAVFSVGRIHSYLAESARLLQQRTLDLQLTNDALAAQVKELAQTEAELRDYKQHLEDLVQKRTSELQAQTQLARDQYARLNSIMNSTRDLIFFKNTESVYLGCNAAYAQFYGRPVAEIVNRTDLDFFPRELAESFRAADRQILATLQPLQLERWDRDTQGNPVYLATVKTPFYDPDGNLLGILGISRDLTARKQTEEALAEERALLETLMDAAPDTIYFKDTASRFIRVNRAYAQHYGFAEPATACGKTDFDIFTEEHARPAFEDEQTIIQTGQPVLDKEEKETFQDGTIRWVSTSKLPLRNAAGAITGTFGITRDITERKQAEEQLRKLSQAVEQSPVSVVITDLAGCIEYVNPKFTEITGYTFEEAIGQNPRMLKSGETPTAFYKQLWDTIISGQEWRGEFHNKKKTGELYWESASISPVVDNTGAITHFLAVKEDITARKCAEEEAHKRNARLSTLNDLGQALARFAQPGEIMQTIYTMMGSVLDNRNLSIAFCDEAHTWLSFPLYVADGKPRRKLDCAFGSGLIENVITTRTPLFIPDEVEETLQLLGIARLVPMPQSLMAVPLVAGVHVLGAILIQDNQHAYAYNAADLEFLSTVASQAAAALENDRLYTTIQLELAARKQAETTIQLQKQYLEAVIQHSPVAIVTLTPNGIIESCNPAFEELFGYSQAEALGQSLDGLVTTEESRAEAATYTRKAQRGLVHGTGQRRRKDGAAVEVEIFAVPIMVAGKQTGLLGIYHDITQLVEAQREAEAANQAKSAFLATMSHEIRTPMNGILGMTSLLLDTELNPEQREYAETIHTSGDALLTIINDILDFSKIEAGKLDLEKQPFDLRECVEGALDVVAPKASEKGLDLGYLIEDGAPSTIIGDVTRLRQILINLLSNACKFTEKGEVVVMVKCDAETRRRGDMLGELGQAEPVPASLHFSVRDTGIGIPAERKDRLFKSFSQVDASTTRKYGGTGLGLAISKRLAEMMGGTMWVESQVGQGSTFHFTIVTEAAPSQVRVFLRGNQPQLAGKRVLIVDDNATNRYILSRQVQSWNMFPQDTASPLQALDWIQRGDTFDVAILDMQMPEMDGVTLAGKLHRQPNARALPLVLLTSLGRREVNATQFAAALSKPIKPSQLYNALVTVFAHHPALLREQAQVQPQFDSELAERRPLRILIAEDHIVNQKLARQMLKKMGYRADIASNGLEAIQALERQPYDVILMDVQMPELDGLEATRRICQDWPSEQRPRIIAMTANALQGDREACLAAGMDDYISKPIQVKDLQAALERAGQIVQPSVESTSSSAQPDIIDWSVLAKLRTFQEKGQPDFVQEMLDLYLSETPPLLHEIEQAIAQGRAEALRYSAHTLKGNSKSLGVREVGALSEQLELIGRNGSLDGAAELRLELERAFERARAALAQRDGRPN